MTAGTSSPAEFNPRYPNALALACVSCFVVILALPMLSGGWLAAPHGDQWSSGYAFDAWETAEWRAHGSIPLWNPMIMSGLPYIAVVTHGDVLYPTALLRAFLPAHVVMNLSSPNTPGLRWSRPLAIRRTPRPPRPCSIW